MSDKINIALIEDDARFRSSLKKYFELTETYHVVFDAGSVESGLEALKKSVDVQILVLDIGLPGMTGIEGIQHFKEIAPSLDIVMLTSYEEEEKILKALCAGACSYISKKSSLAEISSALEVVKNGGSFMSPAIAREIVQYFSSGQKTKEPDILTPRQNQIMKLMIDGNTYATIAFHLSLSKETVKSHIKNIYSNLHVNNKAQAIARYMAN